jgi:hypothetical protein
LTRLEGLGVELQSVGTHVFYAPGDWQKVPGDLRAIVRQCGYELARMIGDTRRTGA